VSRTTILEELHDGVAVLTLNRPARRNAFNDQQYDDLREALAGARKDDAIRAVLITGSPGAFSAGQDIDEMGSGRSFTPFVDQVSTFDKPLLAAVNGVAVGIGLTLLPHCDLVYVADSARLRAPFVSLGLVCEAGSSLLLPMIVGPQHAADVLLSGDWITAQQAVEMGLALRCVPEAELLPVALSKAKAIAAQPLAALRESKRLLLATRADALRMARTREDAIQMKRLGSPENLAAIQAFQRRRKV